MPREATADGKRSNRCHERQIEVAKRGTSLCKRGKDKSYRNMLTEAVMT